MAAPRRFARRLCLAAGLALVVALVVAGAARGLELVEVVKKVENSVVRVDTNAALGSGVIVDDRGWILTNFHVIADARKVEITLKSGRRLAAKGYVAVDPLHDLALLKTEHVGGSMAIAVAANLPAIGEKVAAFGNPQGFSFTTSEGIIAAIRSGQEVIDIIGSDEYAFLGYGADATWIQTTAPISGGNSGGPLVNMNAELVGLNTWSQTRGQNLNFAITLPDIKRLLGLQQAAAAPHDFATLPKTARPAPAPLTPGDRDEFHLELPTGRVFTFGVFATATTPVVQASRADGQNDNLVLIRHPNGAMYAAAFQEKGILDGLTIAQYENREPMVYANYVDGKRHGLLKTWNEAGNPVLFAQYLRGRRHGFTCLFDDSRLALIAQYANDKLEYCQLMADRRPLQGFPSEAEADKHEKARDVLKKLADVEQLLTRNEVDFRKQVREFELDRRRELASQLGPVKRRRISDRSKQRAAENAAFFRELERMARGR